VLGKAIEVAGPARLPVMIHIGDTASPLPRILAMLRPGDIVTHMYATVHGIFDGQAKILPEVREARRRGIRFDFGYGRTEHWTWENAEAGLRQGFPPDTISTDMDLLGRSEQVLSLPNVMSKFLLMGMPLPQVIACVTRNAASSIRAWNSYGTLRPGAAADIAVLELAQGSFEFVDNYGNRRVGSQKLTAYAAVASGRVLMSNEAGR
jgi:dihydroorotase